MRLDVFLKRVGLIKQRSLAKETCDRGLATVDGRKAKAGKEIGVGSTVGMKLPIEYLEIEVKGLPNRNYKHKQGAAFYTVMRHEKEDL